MESRSCRRQRRTMRDLGLSPGQPVPCLGAALHYAGYLRDAGGGFRRQVAVQSGLSSEFAQSGQALVDGRGTVALLLQPSAMGLYAGPGKSRSPLPGPPGEEVVQGFGVHLLRGGTGNRVQHEAADVGEVGRQGLEG